jgi:hypothetical protein
VFTKAKYLGFAAGVLLMGVCASAQTVVGGSPSVLIPAVGVAPTESVQVNVTNMAPLSPNGGVEPNCSGIILFYYSPANSPNSVLPFAETGFSVASGQSFSFSAPYSSTSGTGGRQVIRAAINLAITTSGTTPACILVSSVETFDTSSSVVHAVINPPAVTQGVASSSQARAAATSLR